jgi:hypothetical protein
MSQSRKGRRWGLEHWQTVFAGLLVLIGLVYTIAAVAQWLAMKEQAREMVQQLDRGH